MAERAAQLDAALRAAGLDDKAVGGMGLYRVIKAPPAVLDRITARAREAGIVLRRTRYGWVVVSPPITVSTSELIKLSSALSSVAEEMDA